MQLYENSSHKKYDDPKIPESISYPLPEHDTTKSKKCTSCYYLALEILMTLSFLLPPHLSGNRWMIVVFYA